MGGTVGSVTGLAGLPVAGGLTAGEDVVAGGLPGWLVFWVLAEGEGRVGATELSGSGGTITHPSPQDPEPFDVEPEPLEEAVPAGGGVPCGAGTELPVAEDGAEPLAAPAGGAGLEAGGVGDAGELFTLLDDAPPLPNGELEGMDVPALPPVAE